MDTSALKSFAPSMRRQLMDGVRQRMRYWGFTAEEPAPDTQPQPVEGGYLFRGEVIADATVPDKWTALKQQVRTRSVEDVIEEAAYTWFNRLIAIRILEKNGYDPTILGYAEGTTQPELLYKARQGLMPYADDDTQERVRQALLESDDSRAFGHLLVAYCQQHDLLRHVFGRVSDYTELLLPATLLETDGPLHQLVATEAIPEEAYQEVELIGWLYQFYIAEKKQAVYDSKKKFQPEDIPAATQIFTPRWIVRYLVENTVGKLYLERYPDSPLRDEMEYLVENEQADADDAAANGTPTGGTQGAMFKDEDSDAEGPPFERLQDLRLFDPAAGSGHILVVGFELLLQMYREQGYTDRDAVGQILQHNLLGLDIDPRAVQLARFALLMKAAQHDRRVLRRPDQQPRVHALPARQVFSTGELTRYFGEDTMAAHGKALQEALTLMADHGQNVGSALKLDLSAEARRALKKRMAHWDEAVGEGAAPLDLQALHHDLTEYLLPLLILTDSYSAVATNPPYASSRNINKPLKNYLKETYPDAKKDLFATFMKVLPNHTVRGGRFAFITPPSWMFLSSYEDLRTHYIDHFFFDSLLHLSRGIFGADFGSVATAAQKAPQQGRRGTYFRLVERTFQEFHARHLHDLFRRVMEGPDFRYDFSEYEKDGFIPEVSNPDGQKLLYPSVDQRDFEKIPGAPIAYWVPEAVITAFEENPRLAQVGKPRQGMATSDNKRFLRHWPEVNWEKLGLGYRSRAEAQQSDEKWYPYNKGGGYQKWYGNLQFVVNWKNDGREIKNFDRSVVRNEDYYFKEGITWSDVSSGDFACRHSPGGLIFDVKGSSAFPDKDELFPVMGFLNSSFVTYTLHVLNPTMSYQVGNIRSLPYKHPEDELREKIESATKHCVAFSRKDWDSRETSWDFTQHPLVKQEAASLNEAYASWKQQTTGDFFQLHANEEELNELFIGLYGLEDELSPRVGLGDITILEDDLDRKALAALDKKREDVSEDELRERMPFLEEVPIRQLLSYAIGVMMGRYRLGRDGLHIAHPNATAEERAPYKVEVPVAGPPPHTAQTFSIDDNAIVPLMGRESPFSDDAVYRMREILKLLWGEEQLTATINFINQALSTGASRGYKNPKEITVEEWLVSEFWDYHKSLYSVPYYGKKPIYWLFQSPKGYFQVLVYMHRMTKYTPQQIRQQYLHPYQKSIAKELEGLEARPTGDLSAGETKRLELLRKKATDARTYDDILKAVAAQHIAIDLDDGVQENYPKFGKAVAGL